MPIIIIIADLADFNEFISYIDIWIGKIIVNYISMKMYINYGY